MPNSTSELPLQEVCPLDFYENGELVVFENSEATVRMAEIALESEIGGEGAVLRHGVSPTDTALSEASPGLRSSEEIMEIYMSMADGEPGDLTLADALVLIDDGNPGPVVTSPEWFSELELNAEIAQRIINVGGEGVSHLLSGNFEGVRIGPEVAHKLIDAGFENVVSERMDAFDELDAEIAYRLVDEGLGDAVVEHLNRFNDLVVDVSLVERLHDAGGRGLIGLLSVWETLNGQELNADLAEKMVDAGGSSADAVALHLEKFQGLKLDAQFAKRLIRSGREGIDRVLGNPSQFAGLELNAELAGELIKDGYIWAVSYHLQNFVELDAATGSALIEGGYPISVAFNPAKFRGLELNEELAERLLAEGGDNVSGVLYHAEMFDGLELNAELAQRLIDKGDTPAVAHYIDKFSKLNRFTLSTIKAEVAESTRQVLQGHPDWNTEPSEEFIDRVVERVKDPDGLLMTDYLRHLYPLSEKSVQRIRELLDDEEFNSYPHDAKDPRAKDRWFGNMSYAYLNGGFNKTAIGRIIRLRLEQGIEDSIHDASQWMSNFKIPETAYDTQAIIKNRKHRNFQAADYQPELLYDPEVERDFFVSILNADFALRRRLNLSSKEGAAEQLFYAYPELQLLYRALTYGEFPMYKQQELDLESVVSLALEMADEFTPNAFGHDKDETTHGFSAEEIRLRLRVLNLRELNGNGSDPVTVIAGRLKEMGRRRTSYIRDAQTWMQRHATSPHQRLTKVWRDRGEALLSGVSDNAHAIEIWQKDNALALALRRLEQADALSTLYDLSADEVLSEDNQPLREELLRKHSAEDTIMAISKLKRWRRERIWNEKLMPEATIPVVIDDVTVSESKPYRFDILGADDPRGFTVGHDTGCCMTIHGASASCIDAGYSERNAGFVAMYTPSGDLAAQSFWYIHPEYPDTLVLDNIEANRGRDFDKIVSVFQKALKEYISLHPEVGIAKVNIGTGYTEVSIGDLEEVYPIPRLNEGIYTDAKQQVRLLG